MTKKQKTVAIIFCIIQAVLIIIFKYELKLFIYGEFFILVFIYIFGYYDQRNENERYFDKHDLL